MTEPDELYTLRAQYWLGHYQLAVEEAKSIARRPMSPALKAEREEFMHRAFLAMGQYDKLTGGTPALDALALKGQFQAASGNESVQEAAVNQLKTMVASSTDLSVQLTAAEVFLVAGHTKDALHCVSAGSSLEHIAVTLQIYLKLERLDLARKQLATLRQTDEDSILTQLAAVYVGLATGSSGAADAVHGMTSLSEQYGPSSFLLNLMACSLMQTGDYAAAEGKLQECLRDHPEAPIPDTLVNLIACLIQQNKPADSYVNQMKQQYPTHAFCTGLDRVNAAFDRESTKYKV